MAKRIIVLPEELELIVNRLEQIEKVLKSEQRNIEDPILGTEGVMQLLHVSRRTLQTWRDQGLIKYSVINAKFFYRLSAINQMLENHIQS